ncbi:MAG: ExbD/TolR family protein [Sulfitobacter sp.]
MRKLRKSTREPTIPLINVVFLMLVFFMVAGQVAQPMDSSLNLVKTEDLEGRAPPDALVIRADGTLAYRGNDLATPEEFAAQLTEADRAAIRIVPDRDLPAAALVRTASALRAAGAQKVIIVTERGLE